MQAALQSGQAMRTMAEEAAGNFLTIFGEMMY
jgi:hypothetical protein